MKISAMITVFNEEKSIKKCLDSLNGVVDEIVVVHGGICKDNTLNIAKKYTDEVFIDKDYGVACPNRPFGFAQCTGEWVLQLDADEWLSESLQKNLRGLAEKEDVDAYEFRWLNTNPDEDLFILGRKLKLYKPIFFRKSKLINEGIVHEPTKTSGKLVRSEYVLNHEHPSPEVISPAEVLAKKERRWPKIDAQYRVQIGKAPRSKWFYLAKAPVWFVLYFLYYGIGHLYILGGKRGIRTSVYKGVYNFRLNYYLYKFKDSGVVNEKLF